MVRQQVVRQQAVRQQAERQSRRAVAAVGSTGMFALKSVIARTKGSKWESSKR